jgi:tRNA/rRNA methyltransferase
MSAENQPIVILVEPQMGENIGACARAMLNCGLEHMRIVKPRDGWPNPAAVANAAGADKVLDGVVLYDDLRAAVADCQAVYVTIAWAQNQIKPVITPRQLAGEARTRCGQGQRVAFVFGRERTGLHSDEISLGTAICTVPLNPDFASLNLAQAVLLMAWEWRMAADATPPRVLVTNKTVPATRGMLMNFLDHLNGALVETGFLGLPAKRPTMIRNIRNIFTRLDWTEQEINTLHGMIVKLRGQGRSKGVSGEN